MQEYANYSVEQLVGLCLEKDILIEPDMLGDKQAILSLLSGKQEFRVDVLKNYTKAPRKRTTQDFVRYFRKRYVSLSRILQARKELDGATSIARIKGKKEREQVALIVMVVNVRETRNKHLVLTVEDLTGTFEVWLHADNKELREVAPEIVPDEVIGITGQVAGNRIFAQSVIFPDVPQMHELKKAQDETYVVFVGDVEIGSKLFMKEEYRKFIDWLAGNLGSPQQRRIAQKVGYVVFVGDLVHGVGVYPGQQEDSDIHDIKLQYDEFAKYVKMIPQHIQIVLTTGNHDAGRLQEPQLPVYKDFAEELYAMPNVYMVSNPSLFTIHKTPRHPGFDVLLYHGYSLVYYANTVQPIRDKGGLKATEEVMKLYLKKRHLAPTHGCNTYVPDPEEDPMVIEKVPDFLVTGHVHDIGFGTYKGVTMINAGCWNDVSDEQIKRGLEPQPARLPIVNLKTRELRIMNFYPKKEEAMRQGPSRSNE